MEQARHIIGGMLLFLPMVGLLVATTVFAHRASNRSLARIDNEIEDYRLDIEDAAAGRRPDPLRRRVKF